MIGFKGFNKDLKCRDKQYVLGETAEEPTAELCTSGIHFCEYPLDCFGYYSPGDGSRYCEVESDDADVSNKTDSDSKRVTKRLKIGFELNFSALVAAAIKFTFDRATWLDSDKATGYQGAASATGNRGAALTTGYASKAKTNGTDMIACALGEKAAAAGEIGNWLVLAERDDDGIILGVQTVKVDGKMIKADTYYTLTDNQIIKWVE